METATQSERINLACREAYGRLQTAFKDKLLESGFSKTRAEELATFVVASVEGGIILSRVSHTADLGRDEGRSAAYARRASTQRHRRGVQSRWAVDRQRQQRPDD